MGEKVDAELGRIVDALAAQDLEENTVVVFSSDHGDGSHLVSNGLDLLPTLCDHSYGSQYELGGCLVLSDRYKYAVYSWGRNQEKFLDLQADPGEMVNQARVAR